MNERHPLIDLLTRARIADLGTIMGTDNIAVADEAWAAAIKLVGAGLAAGASIATIREDLLAAWQRDMTTRRPNDEVALIGSTWARAIVAFDAAVR